MTPSVSVVVTTYNQERYIGPAIESVLAQTHSDYEVIVVDDGSTDRTFEHAAAFGSRITLVRQENRGPAGSRNAGVARARGRLVAFLDGDDLWEPGKLERQVAAARAHPGSGLIATDGVQVHDGNVLSRSLFAPTIRTRLAGRASFTGRCYEELLGGNLISSTSQVMVPRTVLEEVGPSDTAFPIASDWDLYIRIAARHEATFLAEPLIRWRYLPTSASGPASLRHLRWATDEIAVLRKHLGAARGADRRLIRERLAVKIRATADAAYDMGVEVDRGLAGRYLLGLVRQNPASRAAVLCLLALYIPRGLTRRVGKRLRQILRLPRVSI